ncbi:hypothetical protein M0G43_15715 [Subsaxibacter sp. CAU 1640]|uniref:hypothetical protein n=1 Tax=Subsaxibacter sp. CAU 1640 TaxID=2933271 RepID=UPI002003A46A|nr:hypothetical protein [Subsaxibacter sp. CAU 1640]MCK7592036.1 hypothetical protein [Subsaxibacter sp. CAU 1640]
MKAKWYIVALVLALSCVGIFQNKISAPNQEILLQFNSENVSEEQSQLAIANIKHQLEYFGVDDVLVSQQKDGHLKISYYSSVDIECIKQSLSESENYAFDYTSKQNDKLPKNDSKDYNLDIYEIHKDSNGNNGAAGKALWIAKQDYDRFLNPNIPFSAFFASIENIDSCIKNTAIANRSVVIITDNSSHIIPEVRAGPISI